MIYLYPTMIPSDTFKTIHLPATGIYKEKGSSFISYIYPLLDESKTKLILAELKKEHAKARHICYAYQWGPDPDYTRHQDDGEPSGTAGKPILGQIRSHQLENVLLAVVRYFGGTLLGASGLGTAYKSAALDAIQHGEIITLSRNVYFKLTYSYPMEKYLVSWITKMDGLALEKAYAEQISSVICFPISTKEMILPSLDRHHTEYQWPEQIQCEYLREDRY